MADDKWEKFATHEDKADKWEQYAVKPKSLSPVSEPKPHDFYGKHPYVSEGILGAASGVGIPESKTPVKDIGKDLAKTFELGPNELDQDAFSKVMSYIPVAGPVYRMGAGLGEQTAKFGKELFSGETKQRVHGAAGLTTEALSLLWGVKKGEPVSEGKVNRLTAATGGYPEDLNIVKGDLDGASKSAGKPKDAAGLRDLTRTALDKNTTEFSLALQPIAAKKVVPLDISNRIMAKITPELRKTPEGRALEAKLRNAAVDYQRPWSMQELYQHLQRKNAQSGSFFKKSETGRSAAIKAEADEIIDQAAINGVKDILYPEMDAATGKPKGYHQALQQRQSALLRVKDAANTTVKELGRKESLIKGAPLRQKIVKRVSGYIHPLSGRGGVSLHRLTDPVGLSELSAADASARGAFTPHPMENAAAYIRSFKPTTAGKGVPAVLPRNQRQLTPLE